MTFSERIPSTFISFECLLIERFVQARAWQQTPTTVYAYQISSGLKRCRASANMGVGANRSLLHDRVDDIAARDRPGTYGRRGPRNERTSRLGKRDWYDDSSGNPREINGPAHEHPLTKSRNRRLGTQVAGAPGYRSSGWVAGVDFFVLSANHKPLSKFSRRIQNLLTRPLSDIVNMQSFPSLIACISERPVSTAKESLEMSAIFSR